MRNDGEADDSSKTAVSGDQAPLPVAQPALTSGLTGLMAEAAKANRVMTDPSWTSGLTRVMAEAAKANRMLNDPSWTSGLTRVMAETAKANRMLNDPSWTSGLTRLMAETAKANRVMTDPALTSGLTRLMAEAAKANRMLNDPGLDSRNLAEVELLSVDGAMSTWTTDHIVDEVRVLLEASRSGVEDSSVDPGLAAVWLDAASQLREWMQHPHTRIVGSFAGLAALSVWWMDLKVYEPEVADLIEVPLTLLAGLLLQLAFMTWKN